MKLKILKVSRNSSWYGDPAIKGVVIETRKAQKQHFSFQIEQGMKPTRGGWWHYVEGDVIESSSDLIPIGFPLSACEVFCKRLA